MCWIFTHSVSSWGHRHWGESWAWTRDCKCQALEMVIIAHSLSQLPIPQHLFVVTWSGFSLEGCVFQSSHLSFLFPSVLKLLWSLLIPWEHFPHFLWPENSPLTSKSALGRKSRGWCEELGLHFYSGFGMVILRAKPVIFSEFIFISWRQSSSSCSTFNWHF